MKYRAISMALALAACTTPPPQAAPPPVVVAPPVTNDSATGKLTVPVGVDAPIDAPKSGPVAFDLRKDDAGKTISLHVGQRVSVSLVGVPTAGYLWAAPAPPAFLKLDGQTSGPTHTDQLKPGFTGGNHWEVTIYTVTAAGSGVLKFEQRRPWETNTPPADTWSVTLVAK